MLKLQRDERGNLVAGVSVMMILFLLSVAVLSRTLGTLNSVSRTADFSAALASADAGLADALFQIDQVRGASFSGTGSMGQGAYEYVATKVNDNTWSVKVKGTIDEVPHAIQATVQRDSEFPYALFTEQALTFNGNGTLNITSYNAITGQNNTGNAIVGSNGAITINGGGGGDGQHYYTPNGSCSGCPNPTQKQGPRNNEEPTAPSTYQSCPATGVFGTTVQGMLVIDGGGGLAYKCERNISFATGGNITILNPPLKIWVGANYAVSIADAAINTGAGSKGKDFILEKAGTGVFDVGQGSHAGSLFGIVYAPSTDITVDGGQMYVDGSLTLNSFRVNGNPNFELRYDDTIQTILATNWEVRNWREIPSAQY